MHLRSLSAPCKLDVTVNQYVLCYAAQIERLPVQHLPGMARREGARWDAWQAMRLGTDMLRWMHQCARAQPDTHLVFSYAPGPNGAPGEVHCRVNKEGRLPERLAGLLG